MTAFNSADWMQDNLALLGNRKLIDICITGSHDSGMSVVQHGTAGSNACNTQTQSNDIAGQLDLGARYFDIRPVIGSGDYYTGHYTKISIPLLGDSMQGSRGQSIKSIVDQVNEFTDAHAELVILNLSHDMDTDAGNSNYPSFNQNQWNGLFALLSELNHLYMVSSSTNLCQQTLNDFIGKGSASVVVIVEPGSVDLGQYQDKGFFPYSSFDVYNSYADTSSFPDMAKDQFAKMDKERAQGNYFLLSWTLTQGTSEVISCVFSSSAESIRDAATKANNQLQAQIESHVSPTAYPNILYTDNIITNQSAQTAMWINQKLSA